MIYVRLRLTISTYFRSMPDTHGLIAETDADLTIHLDCRSEPFEVLLESLQGFLPPIEAKRGYDILRFDQIQQVLDIGTRYRFTSLPRIISPIMHIYAITHPWETFKFAAKADVPTLASYSLDKLSLDDEFKKQSVLTFDHKLLEGIPLRYVMPLVRNMTLFHEPVGSRKAINWKSVAYHFPELREVSGMTSQVLTLVSREPGSSETQ